MEYGFSTKKEYNGGLGLHLLDEITISSKATLQILSGNSLYWRRFNPEMEDLSTDLKSIIPGTIVSIEFDLKKIDSILDIKSNKSSKLFKIIICTVSLNRV